LTLTFTNIGTNQVRAEIGNVAGSLFLTNSVGNITQGSLNLLNSAADVSGLHLAITNPATNRAQFEISGTPTVAAGISTNGTINQVWGMTTGSAQGWLTQSGGGGTPGGSLHSVQFQTTGPAFGGTAVPATNGQYNCGYTVVASTGVDPTCLQLGLGGRAIIGATNSDTVAFGDNATVIDLDESAAAVVSQTLPTATTLTNSAFVYNVVNHNQSNKWLAVNPTSWTMQNGIENPGPTQTVYPGWSCRFKVDPNSASQWLSDCYADPTTTTLPHTITTNQGNGQRQGGIGTGITGQQLSAIFGADPILVGQGTPGRLTTGTADTVLCDSITQQLDRASTVQYTNSAAIAVTIPQAGGNGCGGNYVTRPFLTGAGGVTITPTAYPTWTASVVYPAGYFIKPAVGQNAGGFTFQNQTGASCTSGTATPGTFNQTPLGTTLDNTGAPVSPCTWTNVNIVSLSTINGFTSWKLDPNVWCSVSSPDNQNWLAMCASYVPGTVIQTGTGAVGANTCTTPTTVTMNGVIVGSSTQRGTTFGANAQSNTNAVTGWGSTGGLVLNIWASAANQMSWSVCNQTGSSITPGGTVNWSVSAQ